MNSIAEDILAHVGVSKRDGAPIGSGRYPLGSGDNPNQHFHDFRSRVEKLKSEGMSEKEIAEAMGLKSTTELRNQERVARMIVRNEKALTAQQLRDEGYTLDEITRMMGYTNDSSVRSLLNTQAAENANKARVTADFLKQVVGEKGMVDVGTGVEDDLGISREKLETALTLLDMEGYPTYGGRVPQVADPNRMITMKVLCPPGTEHKEIYDYKDISSVMDYEQMLTDNGAAIRPSFVYPESLDSGRLKIIYKEQGGIDKDGVMEIRRGVRDLDLGEGVNYAQVRILVDGDKYLKGMAVYGNDKDFPDGVDILFNTNKPEGTPKDKVLKPISDDPANPFGSLIKEHGGQMYYDDPNGKYIDPVTGNKQSLSLINKRADEGDWNQWSKELPSQFLSKQPLKMAEQQLKLAMASQAEDLESIMTVSVPEVRKQLLMDYAEGCDSAAVHLKAASYPGQKYQVIMPLSTIKETEVYAPNFDDGSQVALVRFPHGGTFEIPVLTVNNKNKEGRETLSPTPKDAIGIRKQVADQLSGADFDGDTVLVIPLSDRVRVNSKKPLEGLAGFDPKESYPLVEVGKNKKGETVYNNKPMSEEYKQIQMGVVSNLITDMTVKGATDAEIARAVRHSMVVIDAVKHNLDYRKSEEDNGIEELKKLYQQQPDGDYGGASTLLSRAKSEERVPKTQGSARIDPETGKKTYKLSDRLYYTDPKTGKQVMRTQKSTQMEVADDARKLISEQNTPMENLYADYANYLKGMGNEARKLAISTPSSEFSRSAYDTYKKEVAAIEGKLAAAKRNAPRERLAQLTAASRVQAIKQERPNITKEELKKAKQRALTSARERLGAKRAPIRFTDREWDAILARAVNHTRLLEIIRYSDPDELRERTMPRQQVVLTPAKEAKARAMKASGYTTADIAKAVGVSASTITRALS